jgi:hypothetical protein
MSIPENVAVVGDRPFDAVLIVRVDPCPSFQNTLKSVTIEPPLSDASVHEKETLVVL